MMAAADVILILSHMNWMVSESQPPTKPSTHCWLFLIVDNKLTILWESWLYKTIWTIHRVKFNPEDQQHHLPDPHSTNLKVNFQPGINFWKYLVHVSFLQDPTPSILGLQALWCVTSPTACRSGTWPTSSHLQSTFWKLTIDILKTYNRDFEIVSDQPPECRLHAS